MGTENPQVATKPYTSPQVNPYGRVDEEVSSVAERTAKRKKRTNCIVFLVVFLVLQAGVFLTFGLVIMNIRTPKFRVRSASFDRFDIVTLDTNPSFNVLMNAELGVKNPNFGEYKYQNSTVEFFYKGIYKVGEATVPRRRAKARATRKFNVAVELSSATVPAVELGSDFGARPVIALTSRSSLRGEVKVMKILRKKKKTSNMDCSMEINTSSRQLRIISCR